MGQGMLDADAQGTYRVLLDLAVRMRSKRTTLTTNRRVSVGREAAAEARAAQRNNLEKAREEGAKNGRDNCQANEQGDNGVEGAVWARGAA